MTPLALALIATAILVRRWRRRARHAGLIVDDLADDPRDPLQSLHEVSELQGVPLDLDVQSAADAEAAQDLAVLEIEIEEVSAGDLHDVVELDQPVHLGATGNLYGVHTPPAVDRDLLDDDRAFAEGQNWVEALETSAIENGAEPGRTLDDIIDDEDVLGPPRASDARDRPVADFGSGGRRGL